MIFKEDNKNILDNNEILTVPKIFIPNKKSKVSTPVNNSYTKLYNNIYNNNLQSKLSNNNKPFVHIENPTDNDNREILSVPKVFIPKKQTLLIDNTKLYNALNKKAIEICKSLKNIKSSVNYKSVRNNSMEKYNETLYINAWVKYNKKTETISQLNFGDDINFSFLSLVTERNIKLYDPKTFQTNYTMIGSVLVNKYTDAKTIIWGSGMLRAAKLTKKPAKVCAVRGPKTREQLLKSDINCPEIYGDPALLLPYYYYPYVLKHYKLGIIPHHSNIYNTNILKFKTYDDIKFINFKSYNNWKAVIKEILSCEFIVSESLHGLIIAEAYKIPNYWISIKDINQNFKYEDFFMSIHKPVYLPYKITESTTFKDLLSLKTKYNNAFNLNLNALVNACPVKLNHLSMNNIIKPYTHKVALCCIAKMENNYIREFVEHYKSIGFDNIILYDNNDPDGERFEEVIEDYIKSGFVILKDVRGKKLALIPSYTECYNEYKNVYDWIAFFDIDEFLNIGDMSIKEFLSNDMYNDRGINCIRVCWKQFDDSGIIKANGDYSIKKYKTFLPLVRRDTVLTKIIIKTVLDNLEFTSTHGPIKDNRVICVNTNGDLCENSIMIKNPTWENACLNHYRFRTIEEFVLNKMVRLWPTNYKNGGKSGLNLKMFFTYNKKTDDKVKYAEMLIKKYNISRNE